MTKRRKIILGVSAVALFAIITVIGKNRNSNNVEVYKGKIEKRTIVSTVSANGKIRPENEIKLSADVSGEITDMYIQEGDTVKEGQLLLKINPDLYLTARSRAQAGLSSSQASYKTAAAQVTQAKARFQEQQAIYKRANKLFEQNVLTQSEFDAAQSAYTIAQSEVKASEERLAAARFGIDNSRASLNEANKNLGRTKIVAPSDGVVSALNNEKGERVVGTAQMAGTEILVISNFNNMMVIVDVNENDILQIKKGDTAVIDVDAYRDRTFKGLVSEISKSANNGISLQSASDVTNFEVKIRILKSSYNDLLSSTDAPFLPGMSASVEIQTEIKRGIRCLPIEAVSTREKEDGESSNDEIELDEVVFTTDGNVATKQIVTTGVQDSRYIEITSGLDDIEEVIVGPYEAVSKQLEPEKKIKIVPKKEAKKLE